MQDFFSGDSNLYGHIDDGEKFELPKNTKQMGSLDESIRIYMEDYVYTYLYQYAKTGGNREKLAVLVGKNEIIDGKEVIVISGAIQGKHTISEKGSETFTKETWDYINSQMDTYFKGLAILGWVHTQPGFGAFLMSKDEEYHNKGFKENYQVLYVLDPVERMDCFYIHNGNSPDIRPAKGYFIFYDRNESMREYMLDNSLSRPRVEVGDEIKSNVKTKDNSFNIGTIITSGKGNKEVGTEQNDDMEAASKGQGIDRIDAAKRIRKVLNEKIDLEKSEKSKMTLLAGVSGILCCACLMMFVGLLNNQDRINILESELVNVKTAYTAMAEKMKDSTTTVFASQTEQSQTNEEINTIQSQPKPVRVESTHQSTEEISQSTEDIPSNTEQKQVEGTVVASTVDSSVPEYYIVENGDNLGYISMKFYGNKGMIDEIMKVNGLTNADTIYYGKKLILPKP